MFGFSPTFGSLRGVRLFLPVVALFVVGIFSDAFAQEFFLGGEEFVLAKEHSYEDREVQVYYPLAEDERNWTQRVEMYHYPRLQEPRQVVLSVIDRLRRNFPDTTYKILPRATADRAGISYIIVAEDNTEVSLEFILYEDAAEDDGLMMYRFTLRSQGPNARYARSLIRGKWDYYERAFLESPWPESLSEVGQVTSTNLFQMGGAPMGESMMEFVPGESRSLTVRLPEGRALRIDRQFLDSRGIDGEIQPFVFTVPKDKQNLFIEYQKPGVPEVLKLSLANVEMQLVENLRIFPFSLPKSEGNERLWETGGKLKQAIKDEYLKGWDDVRISEPFLTAIGPQQAFVCIASFQDSAGNRMFARFTLLMPSAGSRGILAFSQVDPRYSAVKRLEDLETGGVMTGVAHSIRFLNPVSTNIQAAESEPVSSDLSVPVDGEPEIPRAPKPAWLDEPSDDVQRR